ncbi:MAG: SNF2-related protein [Rhodococcus sp. (in: high G+C Gram-positive bacteria)]
MTGRTFVADSLVFGTEFGFLGLDGTGIVHWDADAPEDPAHRAFGLARLETPLPVSMHRLATAPTPVLIPPSERATFATEYLPILRMGATVVSSDDSYRQPIVTGPELLVAVAYSTGHRVSTEASWRYRIDEVEILIPADRPMIEDGTRDIAGEKLILDSLRSVLGYDRVHDTTLPHFTFHGMAAAEYLSDTIANLGAVDRVQVTVTGEPPEFSDVCDEIAVSLSTKAVSGDSDWFDLGISISVDGAKVPLAAIISAVALGETHILLPDGRFFDLHSPTLARLRALIEEARSLQDRPDGPLRLSSYQAGLWEELTALGVVTRQAKAWRAQVSGLLALDGVEPTRTPSGLDATLRTYQSEGLSWLSFLYEHGLGGILADDMGLGKTIQTLALITRVQETAGINAPFLIVATSSVVHNWAREAQRFTPGLTVATASETTLRRGITIDELADGADIVITSYTIFRLDFEDFDATVWSGLILDEAQYVKNHQGKSHQCARRLSAPFKLAITGTPMENNVMELWALLSIAAPGLFPSPKKFTEHYRKPIEQGGDTDILNQLRRRIRPLVLRRTKEFVVSDLPPKQEQTVEVDLHPRHRKLYDTTLNRERQKILGLIDDLDKNRFTILKSLTLLRQLSLDPTLVDDKHWKIPSAKTDELVDQLAEVAEGGHRALVFSQFTQYLRRVRDRLSAEGIAFEYLDGRTRNRGAVVERFREGGAPVFLISLKAGGVGLTLTEADYCFVLDPWWNPATEMQAVDRAHRIGQTKTVFVNRYVSRGTIEEKVMALKERKAKLFAGVTDDGNTFDGGLTAEDIRALVE